MSRLHYLLGLLRIRDSFDLPVFDFAGHRLARIFDGVGGHLDDHGLSVAVEVAELAAAAVLEAAVYARSSGRAVLRLD